MRVLGVGAHPDDLELLAGGTLAKFASLGREVVMCHVSTGDKGHAVIPSRTLIRVRDKEAKNSAKVIGAKSLCLKWSDCEILKTDVTIREMASLIRQVRPDVIITHDPEDYMPDHRETSAIVFDASFHSTLPYYKARGKHFEKVAPIYYMDTLAGVNFTPATYVDISEFWPKKRQMIACHQSQLKWLKDHDNIDFMEFVQAHTRFRGLQCGVKYAEAFRRMEVWGRVHPGTLLP